MDPLSMLSYVTLTPLEERRVTGIKIHIRLMVCKQTHYKE